MNPRAPWHLIYVVLAVVVALALFSAGADALSQTDLATLLSKEN